MIASDNSQHPMQTIYARLLISYMLEYIGNKAYSPFIGRWLAQPTWFLIRHFDTSQSKYPNRQQTLP